MATPVSIDEALDAIRWHVSALSGKIDEMERHAAVQDADLARVFRYLNARGLFVDYHAWVNSQSDN